MSRSYKKIYGGGITTARSDKWYKVSEHRRYRARIRDLIVNGKEELFPIYDRGDFCNPWGSPKDGHVVWYWSQRDYLANKLIYEKYRVSINPLEYTSYKFSYRPATIVDWKKAIRK